MTTMLFEKPTPPTISPTARKLLVAVVVSILTGVGLNENATAVLVALTTGAAGAVASFIVDWVRIWLYAFATSTVHSDFTARLARFVNTALYTKRGIRFTVMIVSVLIGAAATGAMSALTNQNFNVIIGAAWTYIGTQVAHMLTLPNAEEQAVQKEAQAVANGVISGDVGVIAGVINELDPDDQNELVEYIVLKSEQKSVDNKS